MSDLTLGGHAVHGGRHVCALVSGLDQEYDLRAPFMREGAQRGDKLLQVIDGSRRPDHLRRMREAGLDEEQHLATGRALTLSWEEAHLRNGRFDQDEMLSLVRGELDTARAQGYPRVRGFANMSWAVKGSPGTEQLLEYEARINDVCTHRPDVLVCCYDVDKFPASIVVDMMRTHPAVIIGGVYHENPYYVPPREMLHQLHARGAQRM